MLTGGGLPTHYLSELRGCSNVGKSRFVRQFISSNQDKKITLIDTKNTFREDESGVEVVRCFDMGELMVVLGGIGNGDQEEIPSILIIDAIDNLLLSSLLPHSTTSSNTNNTMSSSHMISHLFMTTLQSISSQYGVCVLILNSNSNSSIMSCHQDLFPSPDIILGLLRSYIY